MILLTIISVILAVTIGAVADGFNERKWTNWGHPIEALEKPVLIVAGVLFVYGGLCRELVLLNLGLGILAYVFIRVALFDYIKNLAKGQPLIYLGDSCWWDRFLGRQPWGPVLFGKSIVFVVALAILVYIKVGYIVIHILGLTIKFGGGFLP